MLQCCHHTNNVPRIKQPCIVKTLENLSTHTHLYSAYLFLSGCTGNFINWFLFSRTHCCYSYVGTKGNFFLLVDSMKPMVIAVTTSVVVTGCSFTVATTPRVLVHASPHLLLQTCKRTVRHDCTK